MPEPFRFGESPRTVVADGGLQAPADGDLLSHNPDDSSHSLVRSSLDVDDRALFHAYLSWFVLTFIM